MPSTGDLVRWSADGQLEFVGRVERSVSRHSLKLIQDVNAMLAGPEPMTIKTRMMVSIRLASDARVRGLPRPCRAGTTRA